MIERTIQIELEKLFLALSDVTRLRLLALMAAGPASVGYLADNIGESQPKTSRHLAYLRNAGLVNTTRDGKWVFYEIAAQPDPAAEAVLSVTLSSLTGRPPAGRAGEADTSGEPHMSSWEPNEIEVYLL